MTESAFATTTPGHRGKVPAARLWRYLGLFAIPLFVAGIVLGALHLFLAQAGETIGPVAAAHRQAETGEKYGAALTYRPFAFKLERYRALKPDVLIVGSSRVMAFAGEAFNGTVYNSGGAANTLDQAVTFIRAAREIHQPKAILLGLDFWWFNPNRDDEIDITSQDSDRIELSLSQLLAPIEWIADGEVKPSEFLSTLAAPGPGIGALAQFHGQGWDKFGRYHYGELYDGRMESEDKQFERTLERLRKAKASSKFSVRVAPEPTAIAALGTLVNELRAEGIDVTLLLPPIAAPVLSELTLSPEQVLLPAWQTAMHGLGIPVIDAQDPASVASEPCEFIDGFHGGEVTYLRILDRIAGGSAVLARAIDRAKVQRLIKDNAGHARVAEWRPADTEPEIDFLDLGCAKSPANPT